jgi:hypothetical protein
VQEGCTLKPNVNEGRLHAGQNTRYFAQINIAHQSSLKGTLDVQLLDGPLLHHSHTCFLGRPID